ncbi:methylated-DNA--protein-cysteine methyltransferase isoform X2 [Rhincodon typus]|nr:methylated-DNA--protein-cysteine methyltransferase isoform X2 [Rhincodon typus]XP_048465091.1 methylated-DNA--protein-cysteine methyltransferase isoform X2 [Rhincodon typus]XP_048465092.1 methylated-DNA--protein-cysteine methyltransferase isoform X2 [Rhincodon typus]XP_048465093.1 methylated-DNA--protein-cysteine methyltransferase isoform X2 [Rhincodon typus]XP_048465094.1 methylated-DNA--protein-cysteine methyltransferase isoform X2 [Rhincodon typus]
MANMAARLHQKGVLPDAGNAYVISHYVAKKNDTSHCKQVTAALQSPIGTIQVSGCEEGIHFIQLLENFVPKDRTRVASFTCEICESQEEMTEPVKYCMTWLQAYFSESWTTEKLPLPAFHHPIFQQATFTCNVLMTLLNDVKFGEMASYKELAAMAGNSKAVRAVGGAMRANPVPIIVPCHRVICSNGQIGNYMGGKGNHLKQWLLTHEKLLKESRKTSQGPCPILPHS